MKVSAPASHKLEELLSRQRSFNVFRHYLMLFLKNDEASVVGEMLVKFSKCGWHLLH